jgi:hypothetical protein
MLEKLAVELEFNAEKGKEDFPVTAQFPLF